MEISEVGARRAANRIRYELRTIREEAPDGGWYASDRFLAISEVAHAAAAGNEDACTLGTGQPPEFFDEHDKFVPADGIDDDLLDQIRAIMADGLKPGPPRSG